MKRTLSLRLILWYLLYGIAGFVVLSTFTVSMTSKTMLKQEAHALYRESAIIASNYATTYYSRELSLEDFQRQMETLEQYLSGEIWIIDKNGKLLIRSNDASAMEHALSGTYDTIEGFDIASFGNSYSQTGTFYDCFNRDMLTVFSPVTINYKVRGYVLIHKPVNTIITNANTYTNLSFYSVGIFFVLGLLILWVLTHTIVKPIRQITDVAKKYAKGDFTQKIAISSSGEIGYLSNTLNFMAHELNTREEEQRKFISNVSHDFRSPLTSIKGYIEAMLDGTIPVEMQEKYLHIILSETERLNKLTKSLLDLNQFGRHGIMLDKADFDINQLIRNTLLTFEGTCNKKDITFEVILTGKELYVKADMSKIQQVLYNLIDNAIKFSHTNSSIKIETRLRNDKCFISIKDHGIGIPSESVKKIWERFYKTDLSRGKDKEGTGLGLSIVKEIINAHQENIDCISTEGVGTEFVFTLPISDREN